VEIKQSTLNQWIKEELMREIKKNACRQIKMKT
jgi:hypothetical protein